tara:strand:- start:166 stop:588 length:423 start_codon:yes stop_codon:yes gene_type:complete
MSTKVKTMNLSKGPLTKKMKVKDLLTISQGLAYINSKETKVWHTISQNLDGIAPLVNDVNEKHKLLVEDLATKDEHGNPVKTSENQIEFGDNLEKANSQWNQTLSEDIEINLITINLEDIKEYGLDANIMKPLLGLLVIE